MICSIFKMFSCVPLSKVDGFLFIFFLIFNESGSFGFMPCSHLLSVFQVEVNCCSVTGEVFNSVRQNMKHTMQIQLLNSFLSDIVPTPNQNTTQVVYLVNFNYS